VWIIFLTVGARKGLVDLHSSRRLLSQSTRVGALPATAHDHFSELTARQRVSAHSGGQYLVTGTDARRLVAASSARLIDLLVWQSRAKFGSLLLIDFSAGFVDLGGG
jgi:hypothetical protein